MASISFTYGGDYNPSNVIQQALDIIGLLSDRTDEYAFAPVAFSWFEIARLSDQQSYLFFDYDRGFVG